MPNEFIQYRVAQLERSIRILRETIDRNWYPNEAVESKLRDCELEATLLKQCINKEN
jgi:hypothetical protein